MIRPFVLLDCMSEDGRVIGSAADIENEIVIKMCFFEVAGYILYGISISFFDEIGCWIGHGDNFLRDIGKIEFFSLINNFIFRPSDYFPHKLDHI